MDDDMNQDLISILELEESDCYFQVLNLTKSLVGAIFGEVQLEAVSVLDFQLYFVCHWVSNQSDEDPDLIEAKMPLDVVLHDLVWIFEIE